MRGEEVILLNFPISHFLKSLAHSALFEAILVSRTPKCLNRKRKIWIVYPLNSIEHNIAETWSKCVVELSNIASSQMFTCVTCQTRNPGALWECGAQARPQPRLRRQQIHTRKIDGLWPHPHPFVALFSGYLTKFRGSSSHFRLDHFSL